MRRLWQRHGQFVARLTTETPDGSKKLVWHPLEAAKSAREATQAMANLVQKRTDGCLLARGQTPVFSEFLTRYRTEVAAKKAAATAHKEKIHLEWWSKRIGSLRLDKLRKPTIVGGLEDLERQGAAARTRNLYLISLRNLLRYALDLEHIATSPAERIR